MKRILSYILSISIMSCILCGIPAFAVDDPVITEDIVLEDDTAFNNINIEEIQKAEAEQLAERESYSFLNEDEQEILRAVYKVRPDTMLACEGAGYDIKDSIPRAQMMQSVNGTAAQIDAMINSFGGMEEAQEQAKTFGNYIYRYPFMMKRDNGVCACLLAEGVPAATVLRAFAGTFALGANLSAMILRAEDDTADTEETELDGDAFYWSEDVGGYIQSEVTESELSQNVLRTAQDMQDTDISGLSVEEQNILTALTEMYQIKLSVFLQAMQKYGLSAQELQKRMKAYLTGYGVSFLSPAQEAEKDAAAYAASSAIDEITEFGRYSDAPFAYKDRETEEINLATGAVGYREKATTLPGKNGLDLSIGSHYNTVESSTMRAGFTATFVDGFGYATGTVRRKMVPLNPLADFAAGWSFNFSFIEPNGAIMRECYKPTLTLSNGDKYMLAWNDFFDKKYTEIRIMGSKFKDMTLEKDTSMLIENVPSAYCLKYKDGKEEYFDSEGKLILIRNRFDNRITFAYSDYKVIAVTELSGLPVYNYVKITDTLGRVVTIQRVDSKMIITYPDSSKTTYEFDLVTHKSFDTSAPHVANLKNIVNQVGDTTSFTYLQNTMFGFCWGYGTNIKTRPFYFLLTVTHPNGLFTEYEYKYKIINNNDRYLLQNRKDTLNGKVFNQEAYEYENPYFLQTRDTILTLTDAEKAAEYHFYPNSKDSFDFKSKRLEKVIEFADTAKTQKLTETLYSEFYEYTEPQKVTKRIYDGSDYLETIERWEYDEYGDVVKSWSAKAEGNTSNTEYRTTTTYDSTYHYPLKKQYKRNSFTTVTEQFTPTSNRKAIAKAEVYENNIIKSRQEFTYPNTNTGNPSTVLNYRSSSSSDALKTAYTYLNDALVKTVQTGGTTVQTFNYDSMGRKLSETDGNGNVTAYQYDALGRVTKTTNPDNSSVTKQYTLNRSGVNTIQQTDERGYSTKYTYDELGRISTVTDLNDNTQLMKYTYDAMSRVKTATDANQNQYVFTYEKRGRRLETDVKDSNGEVVYHEKYTYDDVYDSTTSKMITAVGETSARALKTAVYTDKFGQAVKVSNNESDSADVTTYKYDYLGNKTEEKSAMDAQRNRSYTYQYGETTTAANGTVQTVKNTLGYITSTKLDMTGNQKEVVDPNGHSVRYLYDSMGRVQSEIRKIGGQDAITSYLYDNNGNVIQESRKVSADVTNNTYYQYDSRNRLIKTWNDENQMTAYTYDKAGNMLTMTTGGNDGTGELKQTGYEYDHRNRLTKMTDPMGFSETYTYDNNGNILTKTDKNGTMFVSEYDGFNRLKHHGITNTASGEENHLYYYYTETNLLSSAYDTTDWSVSYDYDSKGRKTREGHSYKGGYSEEITYSYFLNDKPSLMTVNENYAVKFTQSFVYDELDRLQSTTDKSNNTVLATYTYDNAGNLKTTARANGVNTAYTYNESNLVTQVTNAKGASTLSSYSYQYYLNGAQSQVTDNLGRTQSFSYDSAGRLITEQDTDSNNAATRNFTYDVFGNRVSMNEDGIITNYTYDANNRLTRQQTGGVTLRYHYDNNGNLYSKMRSEVKEETGEAERVKLTQTSPDAELFTYNVQGRLTSYTGNDKVTYTYRGDGKRASKTVNGTTTRFIWNGENLVYESSGTKYYYGNGLTAIAPLGESNKNYYLYDGHGSVTQLTSEAGKTIADYRYDAFGNQMNAEKPTVYNPFRYSGEYTDSESGMIYLRARYYDPSIGRFISEDPVKDGMNWYAYCANDPVNAWDSSGLFDYNTVYKIDAPYNKEIEILQNELKWLGYYSGKIDGLYGSGTRGAVERFQTDNGLTVDGIVGVNTWSSMGLVYRTAEDIQNGKGILTLGLKQYITSGDLGGITPVKGSNVVSLGGRVGTGLMYKFKMSGIGAEVGGIRYYELTPDAFTENMEFSFDMSITNKAKLGTSITGTIDAKTKQHLQNSGYAGLKIGNYTLGWSNLPDDDLIIDFTIGGYLGVGGELWANLNVSELWKRITK